MKAPPRLIDDPAIAPELRNDLERARRTGPAYDVAVGLAGFQAALGAAAGAGTGASATATTTTASTTTSTTSAGATSAAVHTAKLAGVLSVKTVLATAVATAAVATAIAWPSAKPAPATTPRGPAVAVAPRAVAPAPLPVAVPAAPAAPVDAPSAPAAVEATPTPAPAPAATAVVRARSGDKRDAARSDDADSRREIAQLARIKALVDVDPARAYRLAQQGDREFARGMLRQERDALAILALAHSERTAEAKQRLRAFIARYPNSPAREHLTQLLGTERE